MKYVAIIFSLILTVNVFSQSPYQNITITSHSYGEVSICINPKNTNQLVGGVNVNKFFYSTNGGYNWTSGTLLNNQWGVWGDPCNIIDTVGNFYYFHLSTSTSPGYWIDRIVCQKSTNGGMTWNNPGSYTYFNPPRAQQDKEWACVDWTHGPRGNWIYCTWTQFDRYQNPLPNDSSNILFARSTDMGQTWEGVKRINKLAGDCIDDDNTVEGAVPCIGPNGEIYVAWAGPKIKNVQFGLFFDKSTDGGNTWLENDIYICDQPGGWAYDIAGINRCNGLPITCCDLSGGPYHGTIYVNWTDEAGTADHDVKIAKSTNGGLNWSTPIRVNNDLAGKEQFLTWMTIDQVTGYLYILFYDRRNYATTSTDVYLARSTNGGTSFTNERISESYFNAYSGFFGDYTNITAHNGIIRPIWMRPYGSNSFYVLTAIINYPVAVQNKNNKIPENFSLEQNFPNPFNPSTTVRFNVPGESGKVTLKVYDLLGKEIAVLVNENLSAGKYEIKWNAANQPSGVYFCKMTAGNGSFSETKKMILMK